MTAHNQSSIVTKDAKLGSGNNCKRVKLTLDAERLWGRLPIKVAYMSSLQVSGLSIRYPPFNSLNSSRLLMVGYGVPPVGMIT